MERRYSVKGHEIVLEVDPSLVAVEFDEDAPASRKAAVLGPLHGTAAYRREFEIPGENLTLVPVALVERTPDGLNTMSAGLRDTPDVRRVLQVFRHNDKKLVPSDRVMLGLREGTDHPMDVLEAYNAGILESFGDNEFLVQLQAQVDPIDVVIRMNEDQRIDYAEPDFIVLGRHRARGHEGGGVQSEVPARVKATYADPLLSSQYAVFITECDLAWQKQTGHPDVVIAILDEGVDTDHPDLQSAIRGMYDATDDDNWQEPQPWDAHGTACAGLAAAVGQNHIGIRGIGSGCSLFAIRIAYSPSPNADWITKDHWIRRAVDWAWMNGADVLSNSWGGGAYSQSIVNALERARTQGRGGRGSVVAIAAGNESGAVSFPANLPEMLTVSASNEYDEFKTRTSRDGEYWWGSNFGPEVDIAAPGVHNRTTDIRGANGYDPTDYCDFNGTSSATPIVAGACGLMLSANPKLTEADVRDILHRSADKVGQFPYAGGRNDQMGFGRLNVRKAIDMC